MSWATSSISTAGLLHIIYSGGGRLSAAACHLALFLFMGGLLCPIPAAGTDSKQRIRPGVVCIKGGRPSSPCWGPQDDHIYSILEPLVGHALQRRHARAGGVDNSPFDLLVRRDWRLARRPARRGLRQVEREAAEQKGCNQPVCGQNSAILQPGISHFPTPSHQSLGGSGPTSSSLPSGTHITCIRRPLIQFCCWFWQRCGCRPRMHTQMTSTCGTPEGGPLRLVQ